MSLKTIRLYGELGEKFGRVWRLDVKSPAEALYAMQLMIPGMRQYFARNPNKNYRVMAGKEARDKSDICLPSSADVFKIVPLVIGSGPGLRFIAGAVITFIGVWFGQGWMVSTGVSMMMGSAAEMLTKAPKTHGTSVDRPENRPSYSFDGALNTAAQGNPVPVCYGEMIVGSQVISAGMVAEQVAA